MIHLIALIFPFSMVPGGIHSADEWKQHRSDAIYAGSAPAVGHLAQLRKPIQRYVSFARDGQMWWTAFPIEIHAREFVLYTDREQMVRGRCGNLMQSTPPPARLRVPFVPPDVPMETATVAVDLPPWLMSTPPAVTPTPRFELPPPSVIPPPPPDTPTAPTARIPVVPPAFVPYGLPVEAHHHAVAVATAPEPGTWALMAVGLAWISRKKQEKTN